MTNRGRSPAIRGGLAIVIAVAINAGIALLAQSLAIAPDFQALSLPPVVFLSAVGPLALRSSMASSTATSPTRIACS